MHIPGTPADMPEHYSLIENNYQLSNERFELSLTEKLFNQVRLAWGEYSAEQPQHIEVSNKDGIHMHFNLAGTVSLTGTGPGVTMHRNEHSFFYHSNFQGIITLDAAPEKKRRFFDISIPGKVFEHYKLAGNPFMKVFHDGMKNKKNVWAGATLPVTFQMLCLITDLTSSQYTGQMKQLYYEAKVIELFLLQLSVFENAAGKKPVKLCTYDIDCLYNAKAYIDHNIDNYCSIKALAVTVGINQKKLKQGFKEIFGNTIFGYAQDLKMSAARQLLIDEQWPVNKVAEHAGYRNQQHFTVAFKKKYGIVPSSLLRYNYK